MTGEHVAAKHHISFKEVDGAQTRAKTEYWTYVSQVAKTATSN